MSCTGKVYLVGAGPGHAGLITVRGVECLGRADVVLYDYLANPRLLEHAPREAERICLGQHGKSRIWSQAEINRKMVELAASGRTVVRLKGGDPTIFGRCAEEIEALVEAGIPLEVVPGVTAALAAGSYAGIPATHRELASAVALVAAHEQEGKSGGGIDYEALARFPGTLVFYMGVTTARAWTSALMAAGKPAQTPAAIIRRCSLPDQQQIACRLDEVADRLTPATKVRPPVIVIVGEVTRLAPRYGWFARRPLFGHSVLVTRPREQAGALGQLLEEEGAEVFVQPAIEIGPPDAWEPLDRAFDQLAGFQWLVFSSANGVRAFFERLEQTGRDLRAIGSLRLAAIGPGTAAALAEYHLRVDLQPDEYRAEALADVLAGQVAGRRCLLVRANRGREVLADRLRAAGGDIEQVVAYCSVDVPRADPQIVERLAAGRIDWVTVTSSAIARALARLLRDDLRRTRLASLSPVTSQTLRQLGFEPAVEATQYTMPGLVEAIVRAGPDP